MSEASPAPVIRTFRAHDLPLLQEITAGSFAGVSLDSLIETRFGIWNDVDWKARKAADIDDDCNTNPAGVFVAELQGVVVGYITTRLNLIAQRGRIPNLAVSKHARGLGIGRKLIEHALANFRRLGMKLAQIETMGSNPVGQHLYPSCGFEEVARQVHYAMRL